MAGIYQRDQINYGGMLGNAMRERANYLANKRAQEVQNAQNWGNAIQQSGKILNDAVQKYAYTKWGYDQDMNKLATQQEFQAEQNALNRADALNRAREQQAWQAQQNELQRASTEKIAELNRQNSRDERTAQNVLNFNNAEAGLEYAKQAVEEANKSGDINKIAIANRDLQIAQNKYNYYKGLVPFNADPKVNQDVLNEELLKQMTVEPVNEVQQSQAVKLSDLKAVKALKDEDERNKLLTAIENNPNFGQDKELQDEYNRIKGITTSAQKAAFKAEAQNSLDTQVPKNKNGDYKPGALAKWKEANPRYAKALGM